MSMNKSELYKRYPLSSILLYNGITIIHFLIGYWILLYFNFILGKTSNVLALLYLLFSIIEMYLVMPLKVCNNCVYYRLENGLCVSGLNILSKRLAKKGNPSDFPKRAIGVFCPNNLYVFSLVFPILCGIFILVFKFSLFLFVLEIILFSLLVIRFFIIFPRLACIHCLSKFVCPQAGQMGVRDK